MPTETSGWDIANTLATCTATAVALWLGVLALIQRRSDQRAAAKAALDDYHVGLLMEITNVLVGRLHVTRGDNSADRLHQTRQELRLPSLVAGLPAEWTALLRWSDPRYPKSGPEYGRLVQPWERHPLWSGSGSVPNLDILIEDIAVTIRHIRTGQARVIPTRLPEPTTS